jgi:hypothetical protein
MLRLEPYLAGGIGRKRDSEVLISNCGFNLKRLPSVSAIMLRLLQWTPLIHYGFGNGCSSYSSKLKLSVNLIASATALFLFLFCQCDAIGTMPECPSDEYIVTCSQYNHVISLSVWDWTVPSSLLCFTSGSRMRKNLLTWCCCTVIKAA